MGVIKKEIVDAICAGKGQYDLCEIELLSSDDKYDLVTGLLARCGDEPKAIETVMRFVSGVIPHVHSSKRYTCLVKLVDTVQNANGLYGKDIYDIVDFSVVESLQPLERLSLANRLCDYLHHNDEVLREAALWGLIRIIPHMHNINQKEYAQEIFLLSQKPHFKEIALEALIQLMFDLGLKARLSLIHFFADTLKGQNNGTEKNFVLKLLKHVTPSLPPKDRVAVADGVAPLLYYADESLVKVALDYFAQVIGLMPENQRYHYTQLVAGMINDLSARSEALMTIEKVLPFLANDSERSEFRDLLKEYGCSRTSEGFDFARATMVVQED